MDLILYKINRSAHCTYNNSMNQEELSILKTYSAATPVRNLKNPMFSYFPGACSSCYTLTRISQPLKRCSGCQLVAYCGKTCQRNDWKKHKIFCKVFQVKNGKNVLMFDKKTRNDPLKWYNALELLKQRGITLCAADANDEWFIHTVFDNARICRICKEATQDEVFTCICGNVAYCCKSHQEVDEDHKEICMERMMKPLIQYLTIHKKIVKLPSVLANTGVTIFEPIDNNHINTLKLKLFQEYEKDYNDDHTTMPPSLFTRFDVLFALRSGPLSTPLTVLFYLQKFGVGKAGKPIQSMASLNVHIVAYFPNIDSSNWEYLMHLLPFLKELNISINIVPNLPSKNDGLFNYQSNGLERCEDCKAKGRIINYTIFCDYYQLFFSSDEYTKPDVVAVISVPGIMYREDEPENPKVEFQKMSYSNDTLLIVTAGNYNSLLKTSQNVCNSNPNLELILPPSTNPMTGFIGVRGEQEYPIFGSKYVFCLQRA